MYGWIRTRKSWPYQRAKGTFLSNSAYYAKTTGDSPQPCTRLHHHLREVTVWHSVSWWAYMGVELSHFPYLLKVILRDLELWGALWLRPVWERWGPPPCLPSPPETLCWQMGTFACVLVLNVALGHISSIWETKFTPEFHRHCRVLSQLWA